MSKLCFSSDFTGSFSLCRKGKSRSCQNLARSKNNFTEEIRELLEKCTIEQDDALKVIRRYDTESAFHYLAPSYINCNMGHYENMFNENNLIELLEQLKNIKGKFMLTMYPNELIQEFASKYNWCINRIERRVTASKTTRRKQEEWIIMNYYL